MNPSMRVVLALLGVLVGYAIVELSRLRAMIAKLEQDVARLRRQLTEADAPAQTAPQPQPREFPVPTPGIASEAVAPITRDSPASQNQSAPPMAAEIPLIRAIKRFVTGGNTLVQAGVVVLFFGVAFLLRYLAEHSHVSIAVRLSAIALSALVLLAVGWRLRLRRAGYALSLQGGGIGILYLTVFAAMRLYGLLPAALAFGFLVFIAAFSAMLAVLQDSAAFALLGIIGGFLAPVLAATGEGNHVMLFGYYAVLNVSIAVIAWFKAWRPLNVAGFLFTFAIATAWGVLEYQPEYFASTEPFLILFFLLYVAIAMLFTLRQAFELRGYVDGALVFGAPIAAFGLQSSMLRHAPMALAYSALVMSALYLALTFAVKRRRDPAQSLLAESFLGLGVVFLTLAIPLALGSRLNSAAWALEGAALVWIGCRQNRRAARLAGSLLIVSATALLVGEASYEEGSWTIPASLFPGVILVSVACLSSVWHLDRIGAALRTYERAFAPVLFVVGVLAWVLGGLGELPHIVSPVHLTAASLGFLGVTAWVSSELAVRAALERAAQAALLLLPTMYLFFCIAALRDIRPFAAAGWLAWPVCFGVFYLAAFRHEGPPRRPLSDTLQTASAWLLCLIASWEIGWAVGVALEPASPEWAQAARILPAALALFLLPTLVNRVAWPFVAHRALYLTVVGLGLCIGLVVWSLTSDLRFSGDAAPLPYVPLLNPLDIAQAFVLVTLLRHWLRVRGEPSRGLSPWVPPAILAVAWFVWLNAVVLRSLHHWIGVPWRVDSLAASNVVQTCLSIFWAILALATMLFASRQRQRPAWLVGAALMAVVISKLFFVDLANVGSIERIVSFLGVGLAMLVVGYFSPLPPRHGPPRQGPPPLKES